MKTYRQGLVPNRESFTGVTHQAVELCDSLDGVLGLTSEARQTASAIATLTETMASAIALRTLTIFAGYAVIVIRGKCPDASEVRIYLYEDGEVGIGAGVMAYFNIPTDINHEIDAKPRDFAVDAVKSVLEGKLQETVYYRGSTPYRSEFQLAVRDCIVRLNRTDQCAQLRSLFRRRSVRSFNYAAFVA